MLIQYSSVTEDTLAIIGASLSEPHIDEKDVRESYMFVYIYGTSVTYARRRLFNIQGRPHAITVQLREQKKCEHVADLARFTTVCTDIELKHKSDLRSQ